MDYSGLYREAPYEIIICLPDQTYYDPSTENQESASSLFRQKIEKEFHRSFVDVDIFPGASLPAFLTVLSEYAPYILALSVFFSGKAIKGNFDAWVEMASGLKRFLSYQPVVSRNGAAIIAVSAIFDDLGGMPKNIRLFHYGYFDKRYENTAVEDSLNTVEDPPAMEFLSAVDHAFDIEADGILFRVLVSGATARITDKKVRTTVTHM